jgi:hypothetical protein
VALDSRKEHEFTEIWSRRGRFLESGGVALLLLDSGAYFVRTSTGIEKVDFDTFSLPVRNGAPERTAERPRGFYEEPITRLLNPPIDVRNDALMLAPWLVEGHRRIVNPLLCVGNVVLVLGLLVPRRQGKRQTLLFILAVASAFATNTLPDPIITMAIRDIELLPLLYLLPAVPAIVGGWLLAGSGMRRAMLSGGDSSDRSMT